MSVKVAVRVRPFNERELERGAKCCVVMQGPSTLITDPSTGKERTFTFDNSFWSHDDFSEDENGLYIPNGPKYADQQRVYNKLGKEVLDNAWDGYHCCLFAYGQTGSGKSYSMIGYGANKGIVPIATTEIFERIRDTTTPEKWYEVSISMLEIYNECVQDLLVHPEKRPARGLQIRESKVMGVYVQDLSKHPVDCFEAIERIMDLGNKNRSIGSTEMNKTSSRAHTIITLSFKQFEIIDGNTTERFSNINLVDLAGSERQKKTKATKERLKEGCMINLSLTVLGQVINVLAEKSCGHKKNAVVPYRDSALTRILQDALGGNSKTIMVCAISPAEINYDESLNTLKYAERAKKVKNVAVVNESAQDKMIRELKDENEKLKQLLMAAAKGGTLDLSNPDFLSKFGELGITSFNNQNATEEIKTKLEDNEKEMKDMSTPWQEKLKMEKLHEEEREVQDKTLPHITNLNEDSQLSGMLYYNLLECPIHVGRKNGNPKPKIIIGSVDFLPNHAVFEKVEYDKDGNEITIEEVPASKLEKIEEEDKEEDGDKGEGEDQEHNNEEAVEEFKLEEPEEVKLDNPEDSEDSGVLPRFFIRPMDPKACQSVFINGEQLAEEGQELNHLDRIIFGNNTVFLFKYPKMHEKVVTEELRAEKQKEWDDLKEADEEVTEDQVSAFEDELKEKVKQIVCKDHEFDWEFAQKEKMEKADKTRKEEQEREEQQKAEEHQKKMEELNEKIVEEKKHTEEQIKKKQEEYEKQMKDLESKMQQVEEEQRRQFELELQETERLMIEKIENMERERIEREKQQQKELEDQEKMLKERQKENESLEVKLSQLMPLINEANLCAREFGRNVHFKTKLISVIPEDINKSPIEMLKNRKAEIFVKVFDKDAGDVFLWDMEKFMDRLYVIREMVNNYFDTNDIPQMQGDDDPFWDPPQPQLIGLGYYKLEPLAYLIDNPHVVSLIGSDQKGLVGKLEVNILPTDESGWDEPPEDLIPSQPEDLIGKRIDFAVIIEKAIELPENFCRDVYCEYSFFLDDQIYATPVIPQKHRNPVFDYRYHHNIVVTENTIKYLKNNAVCFKVFGYPDNENKVSQNDSANLSGTKSTLDNTTDSRPLNKSDEKEEASHELKSGFSLETNDMKKSNSPKGAQTYEKPEEQESKDDHEGEINEQFDEMLIHGANNSNDDVPDAYRNRIFAQSVYERPKNLISEKEKQEYISAQTKDDALVIERNSSGKKKKKKGKKNKDCNIF